MDQSSTPNDVYTTIHPESHPFAELVRQHIHWIYALALRQLRDPADAEDAAQAVFILLLRKSHHLTNPHIARWLFRSTLLICRDIRKQRNRRAIHELKAAAMRSPDSISPDDSDLARQLDTAIGNLRKSERETILLRFFQGLTHAQIATIAGISEDAAKMRLTRAVQKLREMLTSPASPIAAVAIENMLAKNPASPPPHLFAQILSSHRAGLLARATVRHLVAVKMQIIAMTIFAGAACGSLTIIATHHLLTRADSLSKPTVSQIVFPSRPVGVYYISGPVPRPGVYQTLGRPLTLRQAILAAGGFDHPPAADSFLEIFRRLPNHTAEKFVYRSQPFLREDPNIPGLFPLDREITADDTIMINPEPKGFSSPIHADDLLMVAIVDLDQPQQRADMRLRVSPQGKISLPQVGDINLLGKTMPDAEQVVRAAYAKADVIHCALVSVARLVTKDN